ncbi:CU044_2847 family protein [Streptomyces sp. NPDC058953]|uniref:CU044_2847 family protein n=1 Tax=unclassified Streptomyces TaxID=2593676 RepID=UPI0036CA7E8B
MREVSRFRLSDGGVVNMEVDADDSVDLAYRGPSGYEARTPFSHTMRTIGQAVSEAVESLVQGPGRRPRELSIEFNVRLSAEAGATVVANADDGHFRIKAVWDSPEERRGGSGVDVLRDEFEEPGYARRERELRRRIQEERIREHSAYPDRGSEEQ